MIVVFFLWLSFIFTLLLFKVLLIFSLSSRLSKAADCSTISTWYCLLLYISFSCLRFNLSMSSLHFHLLIDFCTYLTVVGSIVRFKFTLISSHLSGSGQFCCLPIRKSLGIFMNAVIWNYCIILLSLFSWELPLQLKMSFVCIVALKSPIFI